MKKVFVFFAIISAFASCNSNEKTNTEATKEVVGVSDSAAYKNNTLADTSHLVLPAPAPVAAVPETVRIEKRVEVVKAPTRKTVTKKATSSSVMTPTPVKEDTKTETPAPVTTETATTPAEVPEKKGISSAAKGAAIGGVGGAVGGAILSKKKGKGAIIGGVLGAAGGYIIGRKKDKKEQAKDTIK